MSGEGKIGKFYSDDVMAKVMVEVMLATDFRGDDITLLPAHVRRILSEHRYVLDPKVGEVWIRGMGVVEEKVRVRLVGDGLVVFTRRSYDYDEPIVMALSQFKTLYQRSADTLTPPHPESVA